ncbi:MAG TPA: hypothetical protein VGE74_07120 [Gemmata sp.]
MSTEPKPPTTAATATTGTAPAPAAPTPPAPTPPPAPPAEPNALMVALSDGWEQFRTGQLISYRAMAIILLVVAGIGTYWYVTWNNNKLASTRWTEFDALNGTTSVASLEEFAKKNPNTTQAKLAELEVARTLLGPEGMDRFAVADPAKRKEAVENVEKARDSFLKLADGFKDDPVLKAVCLHGCAKAEAALVGMPKEGAADQYRGDPKKAAEYLDKVAETVPDTAWGKEAKELAASLRNNPQQVINVQDSAYTLPKPVDPLLAPKAPLPPGGLSGLPVLPQGP